VMAALNTLPAYLAREEMEQVSFITPALVSNVTASDDSSDSEGSGSDNLFLAPMTQQRRHLLAASAGFGIDNAEGGEEASRPFSATGRNDGLLFAPDGEDDGAGAGSTASGSLFSEPLPEVPPQLTNPPSGYKVLTLHVSLAGVSSGGLVALNYTSLLFYSSSSCLDEGTFGSDGLGGCRPCPAGAFCPGGGRAFPLEGWWSWSPYAPPVECKVPEACVGIALPPTSAGVEQYYAGRVGAPEPSTPGNADGADSLADSRCAVGYTGETCRSCRDNFYQQNGRCFFCGSSTDQSSQLRLSIFGALASMALLASTVALLDAIPLAYAVTAFVVLQDMAAVGKSAAASMPIGDNILSEIFTYANVVNFDIELLRPGCGGIPSFGYFEKYVLTLAFMLSCAIMFVLACALRFVLRKYMRFTRQNRIEQAALRPADPRVRQGLRLRSSSDGALPADPAPSDSSSSEGEGVLPPLPALTLGEDFRFRLRHALLIVCALFFLQLCMLQLRVFKCSSLPDPTQALSADDNDAAAGEGAPSLSYRSILDEDGSTLCWQGRHWLLTGLAVFFLLAHTVLFPLLVFVALMRAFAGPDSGGFVGWAWQKFPLLRGKSPFQQQQGQGQVYRAEEVELTQLNATSAAAAATPTGGAASAVRKESVTDTSYAARLLARTRELSFGFLYLGMRSSQWISCLRVYFLQAAIACFSVYLASDSQADLRLFLVCAAHCANTVSVAWMCPYEAWTDNAAKTLIGLAIVAQCAVLLGVGDRGVVGGLFIGAVVLLVVGCAVLIARHKWRGGMGPHKSSGSKSAAPGVKSAARPASLVRVKSNQIAPEPVETAPDNSRSGGTGEESSTSASSSSASANARRLQAQNQGVEAAPQPAPLDSPSGPVPAGSAVRWQSRVELASPSHVPAASPSLLPQLSPIVAAASAVVQPAASTELLPAGSPGLRLRPPSVSASVATVNLSSGGGVGGGEDGSGTNSVGVSRSSSRLGMLPPLAGPPRIAPLHATPAAAAVGVSSVAVAGSVTPAAPAAKGKQLQPLSGLPSAGSAASGSRPFAAARLALSSAAKRSPLLTATAAPTDMSPAPLTPLSPKGAW